MLKPINFLLKGWIKFSRVANQDHGFTLIELLIGLVMAVLVMIPLFALMFNIMTTDQNEQAKTNSEQELQTAMDFITRDLQQAVYIYDYQGVTSNYSATAASSGIKDSLPTVTNGVPILVFWKRELISSVIPTDAGTNDDAFAYSLVAYYLIKDSNANWSNTARIARWQIKDGVRSINNNTGVTCSGSYDTTVKFVATTNCPDAGFVPFNLDRATGDVTQKMNQWRSPDTTNYPTMTASYPATPQVLIDYIDQTIPPTNPTTNSPSITVSTASCPADANTIKTDSSGNTTSTSITPISSATMTSFYVCVSNYLDTTNPGQVISTVQIFIRGNALARIQQSNIDYTNKTQQTYFPNVSAIVQARGFLYSR